MKYLIAFLLVVSCATAKTLTIHYYPFLGWGGTDTPTNLTVAVSPDGTDNAPGQNPTVTLRPGESFVMQVNPSSRYWWYTGSWNYGVSTAHADFSKNLHLYLCGTGGTSQVYEAPATGGSFSFAPTADEIDVFTLGFYAIVGFGLFAILMYLIRRISAQNHGPS